MIKQTMSERVRAMTIRQVYKMTDKQVAQWLLENPRMAAQMRVAAELSASGKPVLSTKALSGHPIKGDSDKFDDVKSYTFEAQAYQNLVNWSLLAGLNLSERGQRLLQLA